MRARVRVRVRVRVRGRARVRVRVRVRGRTPCTVGRPQDEADGVRHVRVGVLAHGGVLL